MMDINLLKKYKSIQVMNQQETNLVSLMDYLGQPAGNKLGKEVYEYIKKHYEYDKEYKTIVGTREVCTRHYKGKIMIYKKSILDRYFAEQYIKQLKGLI